MSTLVLCSAGGAPGVTTTALALAWVWPDVHPGRRPMLLDADPAGSGLHAMLLTVRDPAAMGLLALAARPGSPDAAAAVAACLGLDPGGSRLVMPGISEPLQAGSLAPVWAAWSELAFDLHGAGIDVIVDAGRVGHTGEPTAVFADADVLAVLCAPTLSSTVRTGAALRRLTELRAPRSAPVVIAVGTHPYGPREVGNALGTDVLLVEADVRAAAGLTEGYAPRGGGARSPLMRSARTLAARLMSDVSAEAMR